MFCVTWAFQSLSRKDTSHSFTKMLGSCQLTKSHELSQIQGILAQLPMKQCEAVAAIQSDTGMETQLLQHLCESVTETIGLLLAAIFLISPFVLIGSTLEG